MQFHPLFIHMIAASTLSICWTPGERMCTQKNEQDLHVISESTSMLIKVLIRSCKSLIGLPLSCWIQEQRLLSWCVGVYTDMFEHGECLHLPFECEYVFVRASIRFSVPSVRCFACVFSQYKTPCRLQSLELKVNYIWGDSVSRNCKMESWQVKTKYI